MVLNNREKRRFLRIPCLLSTDFLLEGETEWLKADVLDISIAGVKLCFRYNQGDRCLSETDLEWVNYRFRFKAAGEDFYIKGHFLKVYEKDSEYFTAGVEFTGLTPDEQLKLVMLYAELRCNKAIN